MSAPATGDDQVDPWAIADWGAEPGAPKAAPASRGAVGAQAQSSPDDDLPAPGPDTHRDPFAPGAVRLLEPAIRAPRARRVPTRGPLDDALRGVMVVAAATAIGTVALAGADIAMAAYVLVGVWLAFLGIGVLIGHLGSTSGAVTWAGLGLVVSVAVLETSLELRQVAAGTLLISAAIACVATAWWEFRRVRRSTSPRQEASGATRAGPALVRHHLALRWNDARRALATPGATVVRIVESGFTDPARRWTCIDAATGSSTIRDLSGAEVEPNGWVVLDATGAVLAVAPTDAPRAWAAAVRRTVAADKAERP